MRRHLVKLFTILIAIITLLSIFQVHPSFAATKQPVNVYGNTSGNILNNGWHTCQGDWIYYQDFNHNGQIYKVKKDGTGKKAFPIYEVLSLNVIGDWLYYSDGNNRGAIMKIRTDGKYNTYLKAHAHTITVVKEWIYFDNRDDDWKLYKLSTDGKKKVKITNDPVSSINVVGDWIFYINFNDQKIYKIRNDGKYRQKISSRSAYKILVSGDWVYFEGLDKGNRHLYKIKSNGTGEVKLTNDDPGAMNIFGNYIYYSNLNDDRALYKIKTDGTGRKKIVADAFAATLEIVDGWIIYNSGFSKTYILRKVNFNGEYDQPVGTSPVYLNKNIKTVTPKMLVNGKEVPKNYGVPFYKYGVLYVPLAYTVTSMGDTYKWRDDYRSSLIVTKTGMRIYLDLDDEYPYVYRDQSDYYEQPQMSYLKFNHNKIPYVVPSAVRINSIVYVPYDFFEIILDYNVNLTNENGIEIIQIDQK